MAGRGRHSESPSRPPADSAIVRAYELNGAVARTLTVGDAGRSPSEAHYSRAIGKLVAGMTDPAERQRISERLRSIPIPRRLPAYSALFSDPDGRLWAVTSNPGDGMTAIQVFRPDGRPAGSMQLSTDVTVFEVGTDYLLGTYEEPDGGERLVAFRFRFPPQ